MTRTILSLTIAVFLISIISFTPAVAGWYIIPNPVTQNLEAVYSDPDGTSADILYSYLDGSSWAPAVTLSQLGKNTAAPVLAFDEDGGRTVVWQTASDTIVSRSLAPGSGSWTSQVTISDNSEIAANPWVDVYEELPYVSYEVVPVEGTRKVKVLKYEPEGHVEKTFEAATDNSSPLLSQVHTGGGLLWVDWVHSETSLGYSVLVDGTWSGVDYEDFSGPIDLDDARERIRHIVLNDE